MPDPSKRIVDTRVVVETPEGVDFQFRLAGPGERAHAWFIDLVIKAGAVAVFWIIALLLGLTAGTAGLSTMAGLGTVFLFLVNWFYGTVFEYLMHGQTPGKKLLGLRVVRTNGTPVDIVSSTGRNFLRTADMLPFGYTAGLISMLMTRRLQRLGDLFFDTMVVDEKRGFSGRTGGLTTHVEVLSRSECSGRFQLPERTLGVIERLFEPDRSISDARREEIARPLSEIIQKRLGWQPPGPDPRNPHAFFHGQGKRHTDFLLRVLKTFSVDAFQEAAEAGPGIRRAKRRQASRSGPGSPIGKVAETVAATVGQDNSL
jgi:uncharacterized RDD family membrane protein YckC